jgi:hypothetical protein
MLFVHGKGLAWYPASRICSRRKSGIADPGEAMSPFLDLFRPYEEDFTIAIWDQRGSGKTYSRYGAATPGMNLSQFILDAIEATAYPRRRFAKSKIVLEELGHSYRLWTHSGQTAVNVIPSVVVATARSFIRSTI